MIEETGPHKLIAGDIAEYTLRCAPGVQADGSVDTAALIRAFKGGQGGPEPGHLPAPAPEPVGWGRPTVVKLYGALGRRFGRRHLLHVHSPKEAVYALSKSIPGFRAWMVEHSDPGYHVVAGHQDLDKDELDLQVRGKVIRIVPAVVGGNSPWVRMVAGAVLIALAFVPGMQAFSTPLMMAGASLIVGGVAQLLTGAPKLETAQDSKNNPSYVFGGPVNTTRQGFPVPILYGRLRVGGGLVSASITAEEFNQGSDGGGGGFRFSNEPLIVVQSPDGNPVAVNIQIRAQGGDAPYTYELTSDADGIFNLSSGGLLTGTAAAGDHDFSVLCTDDGMIQIESTFTLRVEYGASYGYAPGVSLRGSNSGGGGSQHVPNEAPDSLHSRAVARILEVISEGPIRGLVGADAAEKKKSVYINETPAANPDGTDNFEFLALEYRNGEPGQAYVEGFDDVEQEVQDGRRIQYGIPLVISITETIYDAVRVTVGIPSLTKTESNGDMNGSVIDLKFEMQVDGGGYTELNIAGTHIEGKTTTNYQRSFRIPLPKGHTSWDIRVSRTTAESTSLNLTNRTNLDSFTKITEGRFTMPYTAYVAMKLDAKTFSAVPDRSYDCYGRIIEVPDNYDTTTRAYTGAWGGGWKLDWTDNPAWIWRDLLLNPRYGLGDWVTDSMVDKWELYDIAQYCDGLVSDGKGGQVPRFTCNLYLQTREEAFKVITNLASTFRGMAHWGSGTVVPTQDRPSEPVYLYTDANVVDGEFNYSGAAWKAIHNAALIGWVDPANGYRLRGEYLQVDSQINTMGFVNVLEASAFGCSVQAQAHYFGRWAIYTEIHEPEILAFKTGFEGIMARPGETILVADSARRQLRHGGRILASDGTTHTLDGPVTPAGSARLWVLSPDGRAICKDVVGGSGATVITAPFDTPPEPMAEWILDENASIPQYRVLAVTEQSMDCYEFSCLRHYPGKYALVESTLDLDTPPGGGGPGGGGGPNTGDITPKNLLVTSYDVVQGDKVTTNVRCTWGKVDLATSYSVEWKKDSDNFVALADQATTSAEVRNAVPGDYTFRVCANLPTRTGPWAIATGHIIGSMRDDWIVPEEKPALVAEWSRVGTEYTTIIAAAAKAWGTPNTQDDALVLAYADLGYFLTDTAGYVFTVGGTPYPVAGWNTVPGEKIYLGEGGWVNWENRWKAYYDAVKALQIAIANAGLDPGLPTETFRPKYVWDFNGGTLPVVIDRGAWTFQAADAPDNQTATKFGTLGTNLLKFTGTLTMPTIAVQGKDGYIVQVRLKWNSGTWDGRCYYDDGGGYVRYRAIAAPQQGTWTIVTFDLRLATLSVINKVVSGYGLKFTSGAGDVDIDWVGVGTYGAGSQKDYEDALNSLIDDLMARADTTAFGSVVIGNLTNLIPNPDSEKTSATLPPNSIGLNALYNPCPGYQFAGNGCRQVTAATSGVAITPRIGVSGGDSYYLTAQMRYMAASLCYLEVSFDSGLAITLHAESTDYAKKAITFQVPGNATYMQVKLKGTNNGGFVDQMLLRKSVDSWLVVDGAIVARHLAAGSVQTYHLSVGPMLAFRANHLGATLTGHPDGSMKRGTDTDRTVAGVVMPENSADPRIYMDDTRIYPNGVPVTYEARWGGTSSERGFLFNMGNAFNTINESALQVRWNTGMLYLEGMAGIGNKVSTIKSTAVAIASASGDDKLAVVYYHALQRDSTGVASIRLRVLVNGQSVMTATDTELGAYGGLKGGYAGLLLGGNGLTGDSFASVRASQIQFGSGYVTIQDGAVLADMLAADTIKTRDYAEDAQGNPTQGAKMYVNEATPLGPDGINKTAIKVGPGGLQVGKAVLNQTSLRRNRILNSGFHGDVANRVVPPWVISPNETFANFYRGVQATDYDEGGTARLGKAVAGYITLLPGITQNDGTFSPGVEAPSSVRQALELPASFPFWEPHFRLKLYGKMDTDCTGSVRYKIRLGKNTHSSGVAYYANLAEATMTLTTTPSTTGVWTMVDVNLATDLFNFQGFDSLGEWHLIIEWLWNVTNTNGAANRGAQFKIAMPEIVM